MTRVDFFYVEAGGGHKSAATALKDVVESQNRPWQVRLVNLTHVLGDLDIVKKLTGRGLEDIYNLLLKSGWTLGAKQLMLPMHGLIRLFHSRQVAMLERFWKPDPPAMVVSLIPHFNRALCQAFRRVRPGGPFVTILTDFADIPPRVWIERQTQYLIVGTELARQQTYLFSHPPERVFQVSGMILRSRFYNVPPIDREAARRDLGLDPRLTTGLILFGGEGSKVMIDIGRRLAASKLPLQLIFLYGRNEQLGRRLQALRLPFPVHVQGFTSEVPRFMQMSDFMIGKPGPGSISEALAMKLPVIVDSNAWTLPQERYNAQWLLEHNLGLGVGSWSEVAQAVAKLLEPGQIDAYRQRAARFDNRAVFEIPDLLARILEAPACDG